MRLGIVDTGYNLVGGLPAHNELNDAGKVTFLASSNEWISDAHGTHVAALAVGDRDGSGTHGIAYNARVFLGQTLTSPVGLKAIFDEFTANGVTISSNSYGLNVQGNAMSEWRPVLTSESGGFEVTARNFLAYRDAAGLTSAQATANVLGGTAAEWTATVASWRAFQNQGGVILFANSNYGANEIANGAPGLDEVDYAAAFPLAFPELQNGWIVVTNATSRGLATQSLGADAVAKGTKAENGIYLFSAQCGLAAAFCLSMDGVETWSGSNGGVTTFEAQSGTSQATPQTAGMLALLREAFPAASGADLAARLLYTADNSFFANGNATVSNLSTASYSNANGTITHRVSDIWGHGFPNLEAALRAVGATTTVSASGRRVALDSLAQNITLAGAFGRGSAASTATFLYNDQLNGVFGSSLASALAQAPVNTIADAAADQVRGETTTVAQTGNGIRMSFGQMVTPESAARPARLQTTGSIEAKIGSNFGFAAGYGGRGVDAVLGLRGEVPAPSGVSLTDRASRVALLALNDTRQVWAVGGLNTGKLRISGGAYGSDDRATRRQDRLPGERARTGGYVVDAGLDDLGGVVDIGMTFGTLKEDGSFLGSITPGRVGASSADTRFGRVAVRARVSPKVSLRASWTGATTDVRLAGEAVLGDVSQLRSNAFAADVRLDNVIARDSRFTLGVAQPLRVGGGTASVTLPSQVLIAGPGRYSYLYSANSYALAPSGREIDLTAEYSQKMTERLRFNISAMAMTQPGHDAAAGVGYAGLAGLKFNF